MVIAELIIAVVIVLAVLLTVVRSVRIIPQARARNVERFGRYRKTLEPGMNFIIPFVDRVKAQIDLREQVVAFTGQPVITEDNLVVLIDTVLFFQVTDAKAADYEIVDYIGAIEQLTATMLRSVIGSMDASGKWGIRVTRVEIKAIDPPKSVKEAMEKQMKAEREKRAAILTAEGVRQSKILTAEGDKQSEILRAEGDKTGAILRAEGQAEAISQVFQAIHTNDPDPKLLAYQYLQTLPQIAAGPGNTFWVIPGELTTALKAVTSAFTDGPGDGAAALDAPASRPARPTADGTSPAGALDGGGRDAAAAAIAAMPSAAAAALAALAPIAVPAQQEPAHDVAPEVTTPSTATPANTTTPATTTTNGTTPNGAGAKPA
jgi:regulator of protease activity HflC (stomatin/prohibitin superfamily)